jgi:hypothetical protein
MEALELQTAGDVAVDALGRIIEMYDDVIQPHIKQEMLHSAREALDSAIETGDMNNIKQILTERQREIITTGQELRNAQSSHQATQNS